MNEQKREKYLPVGSVVLLENGTKRVMINGFCVIDGDQPNKVYDYSAVLFPEGNISSTQTLLFDHEQIVRIDHIGLEDEEEKEFKRKLVEVMNSPENVMNQVAADQANVAPQSTTVAEAPVAPVEPTAVQTPVAPVAPAAPVEPAVAPIAPAQPVAPVAPVNIAPAQPVESQINPLGE